MAWKGWTVGLLGILQLILAFVKMSAKAFMWDYIIVGLIAAVVAFWLIPDNKKWQGWVGGLTGIWMLISAFISSLTTGAGAMWNNVIIGLLLAIAGFAALGKTEKAESNN